MDFTNYIAPELSALVPLLWVVGRWVKDIKWIDNKFIPLILTVASMLLSVCYVCSTEGFSGAAIATSILQGVMMAATAVYGHQMVKQIGQKDTSENNRSEDNE